MEGAGSRLGRASARYGPTQTVFNGPVRKWKKKWVHVSSSPSSSSVGQSNGHSNKYSGNNGSSLFLCRWTPLSTNSADSSEAPAEEPPKRKFRYTPIAVLEEQKKAVEEKVEEQIGEGETNTVTPSSASETKEPTMDEDLQQETEDDPNIGELDLDLCLKGNDDDSLPISLE